MQKEELAKQLIGAIVLSQTKGEGAIIESKADQDKVIITVQFDKEEIEYSALIAIVNKAIIFVDSKYCDIFDALKTIYDEQKKRQPCDSIKQEVSKNKDINRLVELLKSDRSITSSLIQLYKNIEFENDLFTLGAELFFQRIKGRPLSKEKLYVIILYMSYIALRDYDGDFHSKMHSTVAEHCKYYIDADAVRNTGYGVINEFKLRDKVNYFNSNSYVAVPVSLACVPHYRVGQLFKIAYDIYKKKLLFDEDVTEQQIKEKVRDALDALKRKNYITDTAEDVIKGTEYLMSKYTQACIVSGYNIEALVEILGCSIRLIINHLTKQEDAYVVPEYYKEGFAEWITLFENDSSEREAYLKSRVLSSPSLLMDSRHEIALKTGAYCMEDTYDPHKVVISVYNDDTLIQTKKLDGPNDIEYNDGAIGGFKINSIRFVLSAEHSPINKLNYKIFCDDHLLYDSQERLYREALFFCANDGTEAKPGTEHIGEELIVVSKTDNSENYGDKLTVIRKREQYFVSQLTIENGDSYIIDGNPYIFRKVKELELFGYQVPWIKFFSMEKQLFPIYKNVAVLLPASCDKEEVAVMLDGNTLDPDNKDYRIYKYSHNNDGTFVYLVKVLCVEPGYHKIGFKNTVTNKYIGSKKLTFVFDGELHKENQNFSNDGQSFDLISSFLKDKTSISYPYGTTIVKEKAYVTNLGPGELNLLPSVPSYSLDGTNWLDIYKSLLLHDIPATQRYIYVCGPERMSIFYASNNGKRYRLEFEQIENNTYKIPLSYMRSLDDRKGTICFDYGNSSKLLRVFRFPWIDNIDCTPSEDGKYYQIRAEFKAKKALWIVIKSSNSDEALLEREIHSGELVNFDKYLIGTDVHYITIGVHAPGKSLFDKYATKQLKSLRYAIPYDITIDEETRINYNAEEKNITAKIFFTGADQIKLKVYPTGLELLLHEEIVSNGDIVTIDVKHELFSSYCFIFESNTDTSSRIDNSKYIAKAASKYLRKAFNIDYFVLGNGAIEEMKGLQLKFADHYLIIDNSIYAVGDIVENKKPLNPWEVLLKMSFTSPGDCKFEVFKGKNFNIAKPELKRYKIKGIALQKIKINLEEEHE